MNSKLISNPIELPSYSYSINSWDEGVINFKGTWIANDHLELEESYDYNDFTCIKLYNYCNVTNIKITKGGSKGNNNLLLTTSYPNIIKWDKYTIIANLENNCSNVIYTINRLAESITAIRKQKENTICDVLQDEKKLTLGDKIYNNSISKTHLFAILAFFMLQLLFTLFSINQFLNQKTKIDI
ncbi:hypothetical protein EHQ31_00810 [Leptospira montravelensis]|uniref:GOLD domain-containing protein n=1 Tax=Leptospira montravelensis TaxID=2484961 RepID=A0ABY2LVY6_9LEPT|nr:hypothetical protein [Leptospira montravelensis]TGK87187.1 hypothetical protein EHQ19_00080 [Leptospira montravelensis]TGL06746.1 hypothetical protein EHQ31_00810 [Leptospira montravelensis]